MNRIKLYIKDSFGELINKVTWPSWKELQSSTVVVAIATLIIALIVYLMDSVFSNILKVFYSFFG